MSCWLLNSLIHLTNYTIITYHLTILIRFIFYLVYNDKIYLFLLLFYHHSNYFITITNKKYFINESLI